MKKYISIFAVSIISVFCLQLAFVGNSSALFENAKKEACSGAQLGEGSSAQNQCNSEAEKETSGLIATVINLLSIIAAIIAVIMIIVNGLRYVLSNGDSNSVSSAKNGIVYAIVGLVIVGLAQILVKFVINRTTT